MITYTETSTESLTEHLQAVTQLDGSLDAVELTRVLSLVPGLHIAQCYLTPVISEKGNFAPTQITLCY